MSNALPNSFAQQHAAAGHHGMYVLLWLQPDGALSAAVLVSAFHTQCACSNCAYPSFTRRPLLPYNKWCSGLHFACQDVVALVSALYNKVVAPQMTNQPRASFCS